MNVYEYVVAYRSPGPVDLCLYDEKPHLVVAACEEDVMKRVIHELNFDEVRRVAGCVCRQNGGPKDWWPKIEDVEVLVRPFASSALDCLVIRFYFRGECRTDSPLYKE